MIQYQIIIKIGEHHFIATRNERFYLVQNKIIIAENCGLEYLTKMIQREHEPWDYERLRQPLEDIKSSAIVLAIVRYLTQKPTKELGIFELPETGCSCCGAPMEKGTWSASYASGGGGGEKQTCTNAKCGNSICYSDW